MEDNKQVVYKGRTYRIDANGYYVTRWTENKILNRQYLHRVIWEDKFGKIPDGYCVHHIDEDKTNNDPENLECISKSKHSKIHDSFAEWNSIRGNVSERNRRVFENLPTKTKKCLWCGKEFTYKRVGKDDNKFCSVNCAGYFHFNEERNQKTFVCANCGKEFRSNKYRKRKFCGFKCMGEFRRK